MAFTYSPKLLISFKAAVGRDTDYNGSVYFDNITISKASSQPVDTDINKLYDFEDGTVQGWNVSGWGE